MALKGFIFDFDGLIIDTEMPGFLSWQEIFAQYSLPFTFDNWKKTIGTGPTAYDPAVDLCGLVNDGLDPAELRAQQTKLNIARISNEPILPGVKEFILEAKKQKMRLTVASSSKRAWVIGHLTRLGLLDAFEAVFTSEDVQFVKPNPELFILALRFMELAPEEVIVFEDSPNGLIAAKAAGIFRVAVPNVITRTMDLSHADLIVDSFLALDLKNLQQTFSTS
jgi:HAD superfamily hydrolase (TIGR01509 family)